MDGVSKPASTVVNLLILILLNMFKLCHGYSGVTSCPLGCTCTSLLFLDLWSCLMLMLVCIWWLDAVVLKAKPSPDIVVGLALKNCNLVLPQAVRRTPLVDWLSSVASTIWRNLPVSLAGALKISGFPLLRNSFKYSFGLGLCLCLFYGSYMSLILNRWKNKNQLVTVY